MLLLGSLCVLIVTGHCVYKTCPHYIIYLRLYYLNDIEYIEGQTTIQWLNEKGQTPIYKTLQRTGANPGFRVRGAHFKKLRRAEGGVKLVWVIRVKNHDFTPKNHIFFNFRGGGGAPPSPPLDPPLQKMND